MQSRMMESPSSSTPSSWAVTTSKASTSESLVSLCVFDSDAWCDFCELYGEPDRMCRQELIDVQELIDGQGQGVDR